jgi:hypothetical protein
MNRSRSAWWFVAAAALGIGGYQYLSRHEESYGMQALPGGRVTVGPALRGDSKTAPPSGLRIVEPESSPARGQKP